METLTASCSFSLRSTILQRERAASPWRCSHVQSFSISMLVRPSTILLAVTWANCLFWFGLASTRLLEMNAAPPDCQWTLYSAYEDDSFRWVYSLYLELIFLLIHGFILILKCHWFLFLLISNYYTYRDSKVSAYIDRKDQVVSEITVSA